MSASWVAGSVRARSLAQHRLGAEGARALAGCKDLESAIRMLGRSPYGREVHPGQTLTQAQHSVSATALWSARVLAGWLPRGGAEVIRTLAAPWEITNVALVATPGADRHRVAPFELGSLGTAWNRLRYATTGDEIRAAIAASAWGDPGSSDPSDVLSWLRLRWAERLATAVPAAFTWGAGMLALLVARERFVDERRFGDRRWPTTLLGAGWQDATSIRAFAERLPRSAHWALDGVADGRDLWRAEARWWRRVEGDALASTLAFRPGRKVDVGMTIALLQADAWRVAAALEIAARGGRSLEAFDALG